MKPTGIQAGGKQPDVPISIALLAGVGIVGLFCWLKSPRLAQLWVGRAQQFAEINAEAFTVGSLAAILNIVWISYLLSSEIQKLRIQAKLPKQALRDERHPLGWRGLLALTAVTTGGYVLGWYLATERFALRGYALLPFHLEPVFWPRWMAVNVAMSSLGLGLAIRAASASVGRFLPAFARGLPPIDKIQDGILLGAVGEDRDTLLSIGRHPKTGWLYQGLRGMTGNLFVTGAIGWGKSQVVLQLLRQVLANLSVSPALLAIDPKRTFVRELRNIIEAQGKGDRLLWVSLDGQVKFNPIWREKMLQNSAFTSIANTLRLASTNFLGGGSGDSRFWEQSSFNLLKNALVYCAARYDYFTFRELYQALLLARDGEMAASLTDCLKAKEWNPEEVANIQMAAEYFEHEFSRMDEKVRTSILATATSFLNEFMEYRVARILSPARDEITLASVGDAIQGGMLLCLYIENDSLARSIGTLFKLLFQEAVLERVTKAKSEGAPYAVLVMDEYQDVATSGGGAGLGDDRYLAKARESKSITIAATQSVSSLENAIRSEPATREILQNFRTRIFGNSTDPKTIHLFQEPHGQVERERRSHGVSESAQDGRADLFGAFHGDRTSRSESVSTHYAQEFPVTAREFSRLRPFEAFAQVFDGVETKFEKLFMKPYFLKEMRTSHARIMRDLQKAAQVSRVKRSLFAALLLALPATGSADVLFPNVCSVVRSSEFTSCLGFNVGACMCGWPVPRPCAQISYYVPQTFLEVWPESKDSFFTQHPAGAQLAAHHTGLSLPFGAEDEEGSFSFQARSIAVPIAGEVFSTLPCRGARAERPCFDLMSEDLGSHWSDGHADSLQPQYLTWGLSPKACLLKGAAQGVAGGGVTPSLGGDGGGCSFPLSSLPKYPPSSREACNGWGLFFPRSGIYQGASRAGAALMIAARLKSLGVEVSHTVPGDADEIWQMLYPQSSSCFKEGQNLGALELMGGVREEQRIFGKPNGYLFVVWKRVSCCQDIPEAPAAAIEIEALRAACVAVPGGGV